LTLYLKFIKLIMVDEAVSKVNSAVFDTYRCIRPSPGFPHLLFPGGFFLLFSDSLNLATHKPCYLPFFPGIMYYDIKFYFVILKDEVSHFGKNVAVNVADQGQGQS
jgi:hypothetical protein